MKNKFEIPELEIILFEDDMSANVVTSGENYSPYDPEKDYWQDQFQQNINNKKTRVLRHSSFLFEMYASIIYYQC